MGDFNWVSPQFLAFASPQSDITSPIPVTSPQYADLPTCIPEIVTTNISNPFKNVLSHFVARNVGLVVRLNSPLYCPTYFTALGINHIDMIFDDGTCPPLPLVQKFIRLAHDMITRKKGIAVHCKAGLGRTGCLIGAYLIYRHGFTANEVIAFMRFMRPGMVVGPQQHWLHLNQGQFREWYLEDQIKAKLEAAKPITPSKASMKTPSRLVSNGQTCTPPNGSQAARQASRSALGEIDGNDASNHSPTATAPHQDENLPAPTPGQPRKYARMNARHHPYARSTSAGFALAEDKDESAPDTEIVSMKTHRQSENGNGECESEEEYTLRMLAHRRSQSRSPGVKSGKGSAGGNGKGRSVSYTTTTTTMTKSYDVGVGVGMGDQMFDDGGADENAVWDEVANANAKAEGRVARPKTPKSGSGSSNGGGMIGMQKTRSMTSPRRSGGEEKCRVRKTSGRVGSASVSVNAGFGGTGVKR
jgi:cell division cycle 14